MTAPSSRVPRILYADPDATSAGVLSRVAGETGCEIRHVTSGTDALLALQRSGFEIVIAERDLPGLSGLDLLRTVAERWPDVAVIIASGQGNTAHAIEAVRAGAADYLPKPLDASEVAFTIHKALAQIESAVSAPPPSAIVGSVPTIIGASPLLVNLLALVARAASAGNSTVLVRGESGTGKELFARRIHDQGPRAEGPFVKVHCAALPEQLLESELFGYEKGAFTGATAKKLGRVELAEGGTLFLDEIGDISPATQVKLLRILQDRKFERLGGTETLRANVRFVTATHRNLEQMVQQGTFREDLYYRLNVVQLVAPPLRERKEDIPDLVLHFCASLSAANERPLVRIDAEGVQAMQKYDWPGNVRQLQNFVERLVVLAEGDTIEPGIVRRELNQMNMAAYQRPSDAPQDAVVDVGEISFGSAAIGLDAAVSRAEKRALEKALQKSGGNRTVAARILGVSRRTLYNKLEEHGLM